MDNTSPRWPARATSWQPHWVPDHVGTLVFICVDQQVLLIHKKTGHGAGRINGPGGKLQRGESLRECAVREVREEVGVMPHDLSLRAELRFVEQAGEQWLGFVFVASACSGVLSDSDEASPFWQSRTDLPWARMWPDDEIWLPRVLDPRCAPFVADFLFARQQLLDHRFVLGAPFWQDQRPGESGSEGGSCD